MLISGGCGAVQRPEMLIQSQWYDMKNMNRYLRRIKTMKKLQNPWECGRLARIFQEDAGETPACPGKTGGFAITSTLNFCLRVAVTVCFFAVFLPAQSGGIAAKDAKTGEAIDAAIKAIGGADKIGGIKSLIIKGTKVMGPLVFEVEMRMLLPDSIVQIEQFPQRTVYTGISRGKLIPPPAALGSWIKVSTGAPVDESEKTPHEFMFIDYEYQGTISSEQANKLQSSTVIKLGESAKLSIEVEADSITKNSKTIKMTRDEMDKFQENLNNHDINNKKDEWSFFLIGAFMKAGPESFTVLSGSKPGVFDLFKKGAAAGEMEFDAKTGLPSVIRYKRIKYGDVITSFTPGGSLKNGASIDVMIQFRDHFHVGGIMFPRVITTTTGKTVEELWIDEALINPVLRLEDIELLK